MLLLVVIKTVSTNILCMLSEWEDNDLFSAYLVLQKRERRDKEDNG